MLGRIPDPRRVHGRRYRMGPLLALWLVAVLGGATSLAALARFAAYTQCDLREQPGLTSSTPNASALGRLLAGWTATPWTTPWAPDSPDMPPT
ncbi:transposase family protein [Streptomyces sp. EMB26]